MLLKAFENYLQLERNYASNSILAYRKDISDLAAFLRENYSIELEKQKEVDSVSHKMIRDWMGDILSSGSSKRTVARKVAAASTFFKFLQKTGKLKSNPAARIRVPKFEKRLPVYLKEDSMDFLFGQVEFAPTFEGQRDKAILEVMYSCGLRRAELVELKFKNIDFFNGTMKVLGKGSKERIIPFGKAAGSAMRAYIQACEEAGINYKESFFCLPSGNPVYPRLVHRIVERNLSLASTLSRKSPHVLRHTFATHLLNRGADLNAIKELLGHKSLAATQVYVHNSITKLKEVYQKAHPKA